MEMRNIRKTFMKWVLVPYIALYSLASGYAAFDYNAFNSSRIEQDQTQSLQIRKYKVRFDNKEKHLTLVGENHFYNRVEFELGITLINGHNAFANEFGSDSKLPSGDELLNRVIGYLSVPSALFYVFGSGRFYPPISVMAEAAGHNIHGLEESPFSDLSTKEKASILYSSASSILIAPLDYYFARSEDSRDLRDSCLEDEPLIAKRDPIMGFNLASLLKSDDVDNLLGTVGVCHLDGVVKTLSKQIELEEIK